jgi:RsiW-degrading membrane proteinase PrsW (M82 family)
MKSEQWTTAGLEPSLWAPRRLAFWIFVVCLFAGLHTTWGTLHAGLQVMPVSAVLALLAWGLYALPLVWLFRRFGILRDHSASSLMMAFAWGGLGAVFLALSANQAMFGILAKSFGPEFLQTWGAGIVGPSDEEPLKLMGVVLLVLIAPRRFRTISSVMALGFLVGLGFQVVEDFFYTINGAMNHPNTNQWEPVTQLLFVRGVLCGPWSHAAYTAIASFGVGYFVAHPDVPLLKRVMVAVGAFLLAWALHGFWNSPLLTSVLKGPLFFLYFPLKGVPVILAAFLLWRVARHENSQVP